MINYLLIFLFLNLLIYLFQNEIIRIYNVYDNPDKLRKLHLYKTSIAGGLFFFVNIILSIIIIYLKKDLSDFSTIFLSDSNLITFLIVLTCLFLFGYLDDKFNINANLKLLILVILLFLIIKIDNNLLILKLNFSFSEKILFLDKFSIIFTLFCFIAFINAFNLYDGINCQSGFYIFFILIVIYLSNSNLLLINSLFFPLIIFLILNSRGKVFIGNSGTYLLGFIISYVIIKIYNNENFINSDKILLIMFLPGIDMIRLFFIRIKSKRNPFSPDRNHLHHKLLEKFGYKNTIQIITGLSVLPYCLSFFLKSYITLIFFTVLYFALIKFLNSKKII